MTRRNRNGFAVREWQKMRERNEALDCYVYARAAAAAAGLDRFEERHWLVLENQLAPPEEIRIPDNPATITTPQATHRGGLVVSGTRKVIRSSWMER